MFSSRVPHAREFNRLTQAVRRAQLAGRSLADLTLTNPTIAGFDYPVSLLAPLARSEAAVYRPAPFGLEEARAAVAGDYRRRGISVATEHVVLTASTSDAYSLLFKLLCEPAGDAVLVPVPSYPLFDHLTQLDGVRPIPYRLEYHRRWTLDAASVTESWQDSVRALLAVSPNNPTGSCLTDAEWREVGALCAARGAALIVDEVFADYPLAAGDACASGGVTHPCLTFRLGGLSKSAGLPQVKLGWIAVDGPDALVREALERLELICDTYLSVATPVQVAAPALIEAGAAIRAQILERVRANYAALRRAASGHPAIEVLDADGGWSAVVRVPARAGEEELALQLIQDDGVVVHPGYFFDFPHEAFLVVSLLPEPSVFEPGVARMLERADG
jgi:alanine-synthesizing transaminase